MSSEHPIPHPRKYEYFVDGVKYETDQAALTGLQIKSRIANFNPQYLLYLEEPGDQPDRLISDTDTVDFAGRHSPAKFYTTPPATFG
jgi:hypothetical protein